MNLGAILLAAGGSSRMGERHKLLLPWGPLTVVGQSLAAAISSRAVGHVVIVTGHRADDVLKACERVVATVDAGAVQIDYVENPRWAEGMFTSVRLGLDALPDGLDGFFAVLGDMPMVPPKVYGLLAEAFSSRLTRILVPTWEGLRGHPVLFPAHLTRAAISAEGDVGLRSVLQTYPEQVVEVPVPYPGVRIDVDTAEEYARHLPPAE